LFYLTSILPLLKPHVKRSYTIGKLLSLFENLSASIALIYAAIRPVILCAAAVSPRFTAFFSRCRYFLRSSRNHSSASSFVMLFTPLPSGIGMTGYDGFYILFLYNFFF